MASDLIGKTVRLPPDLWYDLAELAKKTERSMNYEIINAVRAHVVQAVPGVVQLVPSQYQDGTNVVHPCPDHARARVDDDRQTDSKKEDTSPEQRIAALLRDLPWYGAKLPKDDSPERRAATLIAANPGVDIPAELSRASEWLHDHPRKRKKQLGSFLASWMARASKPAQMTIKPKAEDYSPRGEWE